MAAIDFPNLPTVGQTFVATNGITYQWTGTLWKVVPSLAAAPACFSAFSSAAVVPTVGVFTTAVSVGPIGVAGDRFRVDAGLTASSIGFQDFNSARIWDGAAVVGPPAVTIYSAPNGGNTFFGISGIAVLGGATTFSLQGQLGHAGQLVGGSWITAQKVS